METRARLFGHPIHPIVLPLRIGLLSRVLIFDILQWITRNGRSVEIPLLLIAAGVISGLAAAVLALTG